MKNPKALIILCAIGLAFGGRLASAQDATKPVLPIDPPRALEPAKPGDSKKPESPGRSEVPNAIQKLMDDFKQARKTYLDEEKALLNKAKEANKADREALRIKIKENRQEFLETQKAAHEEIKRQAAELRDKLKDHREVIDEAKEKAKEKAKDRVKSRKGGDE
jgi:hypothetical protein